MNNAYRIKFKDTSGQPINAPFMQPAALPPTFPRTKILEIRENRGIASEGEFSDKELAAIMGLDGSSVTIVDSIGRLTKVKLECPLAFFSQDTNWEFESIWLDENFLSPEKENCLDRAITDIRKAISTIEIKAILAELVGAGSVDSGIRAICMNQQAFDFDCEERDVNSQKNKLH
jgi:hypothetical protein